MKFQEEFEFEIDDITYNIEVTGRAVTDYSTEVESVTVTDPLGNELEQDHPHYLKAWEEATEREYDLELHEGDFNTYDQYLDPLLGDF